MDQCRPQRCLRASKERAVLSDDAHFIINGWIEASDLQLAKHRLLFVLVSISAYCM